MTEKEVKAIREWLCKPENSGNCGECPYNYRASEWPGHRLPCGQFTCWVDLHTEEEEPQD